MKKQGFVLLGFVLTVFALVLLLRQPVQPAKSRMPAGTGSSSVSSVMLASSFSHTQVHVLRVIDGDTLLVRMQDGKEERVRFIGINAPESVDPKRPVQCYGSEANRRMHELLDGKDIELVPEEKDDRDVFGRLLRYVSLGSIDIGAEMIQEGYAESYCFKYPHPRCSGYEALERAAVSANVGMWGKCR